MLASEENPPRKPSLKDKFREAFAVGADYEEKLLDDEERLLQDIAKSINRRGLATVAIPFLIANKPLNVIGANVVQMGEFLFKMEPIEKFLIQFIGPSYSHELLVRTLEKRMSIDRLVDILEKLVDERP